jgi:phosphoketolase
LAEVEDAPLDLRNLARLIPPLQRVLMSPVELRLRCEYVAEVLGQAEFASERQATSLRRKAKKHLESMSLRSLADAEASLQQEISAAVRDGDERRAAYLRMEIEDLRRRNPQLPDDRIRDAEIIMLMNRAGQLKSAAKRPRWYRILLRRTT